MPLVALSGVESSLESSLISSENLSIFFLLLKFIFEFFYASGDDDPSNDTDINQLTFTPDTNVGLHLFENVIGSAFDDTFVGVDAAVNVFDGKDGTDTIDYAVASAGVTVDLAAAPPDAAPTEVPSA